MNNLISHFVKLTVLKIKEYIVLRKSCILISQKRTVDLIKSRTVRGNSYSMQCGYTGASWKARFIETEAITLIRKVLVARVGLV